MRIKTLAELTTPDERTLCFTPLGFSMGPQILEPEYAAESQQQVIAGCDLYSNVPEETRNAFERVRTLHSYGILWYEAFTVAYDLFWLVMEQAFRERFMTYFGGTIPFVNTQSGVEDAITVQTFEEVYAAVQKRRTHPGNKGWHLKVKATGKPMEFPVSFVSLIKYHYPPDKQEVAVQLVIEQAELLAGKVAA
jgi:hypothetical protein